jgi:hypothetical protein
MINRACICFAFLAILIRVVVASENASAHWTILPTSEGKQLIGQCSRECPYDATSFWRPSASEIAAIEQRLPALLRGSGHEINLSQSYRQYLGIVRAGRKLIYLNAFDSRTWADYRTSWRNKALIICDGGDLFWGVEFDPATKTFQHLAFNGAI